MGLEYGFGTTDHDFEPSFQADGVNLNPELEDGIFGGFIGYSINDSWAVELGYNQFDLDDGRSKILELSISRVKNTIMKWIGTLQSKPNKLR